MSKKLIIFAIISLLAVLILASCTSIETTPQQPQIDENTSQIAAELNTKVADLGFAER